MNPKQIHILVIYGGGLLAVIYGQGWLKEHLGWFGHALVILMNAGFVGWLLWRFLLRPLIQAGKEGWYSAKYGKPQPNSHGTAHFANRAELAAAALLGDTGLVLGREESADAPLIRYTGPGHLLTVAPTRAGKGVGAIIPNLLTTPHSVVCVDPKGENAAVTAQARRELGQEVFVLDPWGITGEASASYNPMDWLNPESEDVAEDAALLADALVYDPAGSTGDAHWNEEAKALISGLLLHIATLPPARRHLGTLREFLTLPPAAFAGLLEDMQAAGGPFGLTARAANRMVSKSDREAAGVLSSAQRHTHFLDSPRMQRVLSTGNLSLEHLKAWPTSVYLVLPPDRLGAYGRWLRLMVGLTITAMARAPGQQRVLFLLDEFAALGHLQAVETAMGLMAGYGVQLWPILQDLAQLKATYGAKAGTFLSNAAVLQSFGTADHETAKYVSDLLGQSTISVASNNAGKSKDDYEILSGSSSTGQTLSETGRPLLMPDEVRRLPSHQQLVFVQGQPPILARKVRYYDDPAFSGLACPSVPARPTSQSLNPNPESLEGGKPAAIDAL